MESDSFQLELNYSLACDMGVLTFTSWGHCEDYLRECKHLLHRVCRILLWLRAQGPQSWCMKLTCGWPRCKAASAPVSTQETTGWLPVRLPFLRALFGCKATGVEVRNKLQAYFSDILHPNQEIKYGHNFLHNDFILNIYMFNAKHIYVYRKGFFSNHYLSQEQYQAISQSLHLEENQYFLPYVAGNCIYTLTRKKVVLVTQKCSQGILWKYSWYDYKAV